MLVVKKGSMPMIFLGIPTMAEESAKHCDVEDLSQMKKGYE